jgi:hypothetical protein
MLISCVPGVNQVKLLGLCLLQTHGDAERLSFNFGYQEPKAELLGLISCGGES